MRPQFRQQSPSLSIYDAVWVATTITLADDTTVILLPPGAMSLLIIAETITIGNNVHFTWTRPPIPPLNKNFAPGNVPPTPPQVPATTTPGQPGAVGTAGSPGANGDLGNSGTAGPVVEMWTLNLTGALLADLAGQDGQAGGRGQDGGPGGQGGTGGESSGFGSIFHACPFGPGSGGNGGPGGAAGAGGAGGSGGAGGQFALYAPQPVLDSHIAGGPNLQVHAGGGLGGQGAPSGNPGPGGPGGALGPWANHSPQDAVCAHNTSHTAGSQGPSGFGNHSGVSGLSASSGLVTTDLITAADFEAELTAPAIASLSASSGQVGDSISLVGMNLVGTDTVLVAGTPAVSAVQSDTTASFTVPDVAGGLTDVVIRRADGSEQSNPASFTVLPSITGARSDREKNGAFVWRSTVTLTGTGFSSACRVQVNGADEPSTVVDTHTITFTITPPANLQPAESGESVTIAVLLGTGQSSNSVVVPVATCRIVVIGDSVLWGEGLDPAPPAMKISDLVRTAVAARLGGVDTFVDLLAHCGAVISGAVGSPAASSEVPDSVPTITAQVAAITDPTNVDLVIVNGGINDVGVPTILNPTTSATSLSTAIMSACGSEMTALLASVISTCPNAQVVVTSYFPILSPASDTALIPLIVGFLAGVPLGVLTAIELSTIVSNCMSFFAQSSTALAGSVMAVNAAAPSGPPAGLLATGRPRVAFAAAPFSNANATLAPDAWLFGINADGTTQDPMAPTRHLACSVISDPASRTFCDYASVGHPNQAGAQQYADAIMLALRSQLVTFTGTATLISSSSNAPGPMTTGVTGPLAIDETDGSISIPAPWSVSMMVQGSTVAGTLASISGSPGSFPPGSFAGAAASLPAALVLSISGPLGTQQSSDNQATLSTGGPVIAGKLAPVTGTAMTASGQLTLVAAGQLTGGYISGDFTLTLSGTLAPVPP
jgi:lysophospholipase L1-like esterase